MSVATGATALMVGATLLPVAGGGTLPGPGETPVLATAGRPDRILAVGFDRLLLTGMPDPSERAPAEQATCVTGRDPVTGYDEKIQFARVRFSPFGGGGFRSRRGGNGPGWQHDYPSADCQILEIMRYVTLVDTDSEHHVVVEFGDSAIFRYPFVYVSEAGEWFPTDEEVENFRNYLLKGGFVVFDDFDLYGRRGGDYAVWESAMLRVLPDLQLVELDGTAEIYNTFFEISDPHAIIDMTGNGQRATYLGLYLEDDPSGRLLGIANLDQDIGEFWEYNARGLIAIDLSNEAFKLGVNYMIYALTH